MHSDLGKLFIGGISWDTDEDRLKEYFSSFGEVIEAVIMKDRNTGRARGFGFVIFSDPAVAEKVIKEKHNIDGRMVEAKKAVPRDDQDLVNRNTGSIHGSPGPGRTRKIFVGGLASSVTESDFRKYFEQFGNITDVVVMYDHNTQRPRGFGFITYDSEEAVDKVLLKAYHELNGKMVEVKRAVPKELSPGPNRNRSPLEVFNYGLSRGNSFLDAYGQGYGPATIGGYGVRMDSRFSPIAGGRGGFPLYSSNYGIGMNFEPGMSPTYGGSGIGYGQGLNPYYVGNSNRFGSGIRYDEGIGGNTSFFSSATRNLLENEGLNYGTNSGNSRNFVGSRSGSIQGGTLDGSGINLGSSPNLAKGGGNNISSNNGSLGYGGGDYGLILGMGGYSRNNGTSATPTPSYAASNGRYDGAFANVYDGGSVYGERTWQSVKPEHVGSGSFGFGFGAASDVSIESSPGLVGGYSITKGQTNRGIAI